MPHHSGEFNCVPAGACLGGNHLDRVPARARPGRCTRGRPSIGVRRRPQLAVATVTQLVTRFRGTFCLTTWLQTNGTLLLAVKRCSLACMWLEAQGGRSVYRCCTSVGWRLHSRLSEATVLQTAALGFEVGSCRVDLARGTHEIVLPVRKLEPVSGFEPLTCRLQGGFASPRGSTTGHLNRPDDLRGHLGVQDRLHAYTTVVSAALAAGPSIRRWTFRSRSGESPTSPTHFPSLWGRVRRGTTASVTSLASFVWCATPGASGAWQGRSYPSRQPNLNG